MPDREKVINALGRCESYGYCEDKRCPYYEDTGCLESMRKDALELLKDQEPVRPKKWIPKGQILARVRGYYCPMCDTGISQGDRFCHRCGRALKCDD